MERTGWMLVGLAALGVAALVHAEDKAMLVYFGTYTGSGSKGIYAYRFDPASGALTDTGQTAMVASPSFLALDPRGRWLYAANEDWSQKVGQVTAFVIDRASGALTKLNQVSAQGRGPCYVSVDATAKAVLVANYGSAHIALLPLGDDGRLGEATCVLQHVGSSVNQGRQREAHAHSIFPDPTNRWAFCCDLGTDKVNVYGLDLAAGKLVPAPTPFVKVKPGAGPRHFAFAPDGRRGYLINELDSTITAFAYDAAAGTLSELQTVPTLPAGFGGKSTCADIHLAPDGRFLYGSNRGHDSLAIYAVEAASGRLTLVGHEPSRGKTPRNFAIDPSGRWLLAANQDSNNVVVFRLDPASGKLTAVGEPVTIPKPVCVRFLVP